MILNDDVMSAEIIFFKKGKENPQLSIFNQIIFFFLRSIIKFLILLHNIHFYPWVNKQAIRLKAEHMWWIRAKLAFTSISINHYIQWFPIGDLIIYIHLLYNVFGIISTELRDDTMNIYILFQRIGKLCSHTYDHMVMVIKPMVFMTTESYCKDNRRATERLYSHMNSCAVIIKFRKLCGRIALWLHNDHRVSWIYQ